jgi:holdfast attachment protein HfaA
MRLKHPLRIRHGLAFAALLTAAPAGFAQQAEYSAQFERPYGMDTTVSERPYEAASRDANGNRVVINGLINGGTTLGQGLNTGWGETDGLRGMLGSGGGLAVGNQLNVITQGNMNTVIINSTQINNGDQTVVNSGR